MTMDSKKKGLFIGLGIAALVVIILIASMISTYNGLVEKQEAVKTAEAQVQTYLQRRADLIPNLVATVKGYAAHEEEVYTALADARAKLNSATTTQEYADANAELDSALSRLLVIVESYPELKADQTFVGLMDQLEGTENRIATARKDYNEIVTVYNTAIKKFPTVIFAKMFGFEEATRFEASAEAQTAPSVSFE